jgi:plasmid stabilization system protein ParE
MRRLILRPEAGLDIEGATLWYEGRQAGLGSRFLGELDRVLERVQRHPMQFPELEPGVRRAVLRRFPYGLYFTDEADRVTVLAVLHLRRHPDAWRR